MRCYGEMYSSPSTTVRKLKTTPCRFTRKLEKGNRDFDRGEASIALAPSVKLCNTAEHINRTEEQHVNRLRAALG